MWWKNRVRGATLAEVLVMMIVAGVVLLGAMDGLGMLKRYTAGVGERITANSRFYDGYHRLESLAAGADSITREGPRAVFWRGGERMAAITLRDSTLVAELGPMSDTLIRGVESMRAVRGPDGNMADSIVAVVRTGGRSLTVAFAAPPPVQAVAAATITENEKEHEYN